MNDLKEIGFYTLSNARVKQASGESPMWRCEMIITDRCNFSCSYCRGLRKDCAGEMDLGKALEVIDIWGKDGLKNIRFSGGEPTLHPHLKILIARAKDWGMEHIAISTNGSQSLPTYFDLFREGVNDFSISLDGCCAADIDAMSGGDSKVGSRIVNNIRELSKITYVTTGIVITNINLPWLTDIIKFAHELGVADIRIISAAQENMILEEAKRIPQEILDAHPILKYRVQNLHKGVPVRGLTKSDCSTCHLMQDDSVVAGDYHFPCIIYLREGGDPIGKINPDMRQERIAWLKSHNTFDEPICRKNCLDVCSAYNNKFEDFMKLRKKLRDSPKTDK